MKRRILIFIGVILFFAASGLQAQTVVDNRQVVQQTRIAHGTANGELTRSERKLLKKQQRHIRRTERRVKSDGIVTHREKARVTRKQNRASRNIRRAKNN